MQTIVLATQKGGSGKSTLAIGPALAAIEADIVPAMFLRTPAKTTAAAS